MKKLFVLTLTVACVAGAFAADEKADTAAAKQEIVEEVPPVWPAFFAFCEWPASPDIIGLRLSIPYSTGHDSVTGIDLGLWGRCRDFEGIQINLFRNDVKDTFGGAQIGFYNSVNRADLFCTQVGLFNETQSFRGLQVGLINISGDGEGFQVGLINRVETMHGYQVGIINVIRDANVPVFPIVNIGF